MLAGQLGLRLHVPWLTKPTFLPAPLAADCGAALLSTSLLEGSRFDPALLKWLLDRGADAAVSAWQPESASGPDGGAAPPATAVLLRKLRRELHASRQLSKLHVAVTGAQEAWLLRRAADCLTLLLAAGAPPVGAPDPSGALAAAAAALEPADFAAVQAAASQPPQWSPRQHRLFPRAFHRAAREVLLVARRGFTIAAAAPVDGAPAGGCGAGDSEGAGGGLLVPHEAQPQQQEQQLVTYWLDAGVVENIVRQLAPCRQGCGGCGGCGGPACRQ